MKTNVTANQTQTSSTALVPASVSTPRPCAEIDYTAALPASREDCIRLVCADLTDLRQQVALRMWHLGRVVRELQGRGEKGVIEDIMKRTGYERRNLAYAVAAYDSFPDFAEYRAHAERMDFRMIREVARLPAGPVRQELVSGLLSGKVKNEDVTREVKRLLPEQRKPAHRALTHDRILARTVARMKGITDALLRSVRDFEVQAAEMEQAVTIVADEKRVPDAEYLALYPQIEAVLAEARKIVNVATDLQQKVSVKADHWGKECPRIESAPTSPEAAKQPQSEVS